MKQQCHVSFIYGSWLIVACGMIYYIILGNFLQAALWLILIPLFLRLYVRYFPSLSRYMGYGSVEDRPATRVVRTEVKVTLYTGLGCPFCPLVKRRLTELGSRMAFQLNEIDVSFKPDLLISKGIRALPVVEIGESRWVGNGTSEQLAQFIVEHAGPVFEASPAESA